MAELFITLADGRKFHHRLGDRPHIIGRDAACEVCIDDPSASRRHARFTPTPHGYLVEDLGSKNGTLVNDTPRESHLLKDGDSILIGSAVVLFRESQPAASHSVVVADDIPTGHVTRYVSRDQRLALPQQRLQTIYELSARLTMLQNRDQLLENAMDVCFETLAFERGAIGIRRQEGRALDWPVVRNLTGAHGELKISRTLLRRALEYGERAYFADDAEGNADPTVSMVQHGIRAAMCVPLILRDEVLGVMYGDRVSTSARYTNEDIDFFAGIAQQVSIGLFNCRLMEDQRAMIRLNHDIDLAREIQTGLLPTDLPCRAGLTVAAINDPGDRISGDYYDVIEIGDGRVWCLVADVTGEGVAAALLMANLQAAVRVTIDETDDPGLLLARWNRLICHNTDASKFITCLLALIDPGRGTVRLAGAGHFPPLLVRAAELRALGPADSQVSGESHGVVDELPCNSGLPLGVKEAETFTTTTLDLGSGPFLLFFYTDGVVEAMSGANEAFGQSRLRQAILQHPDLNPKKLVNQVRGSVAQFASGVQQSDDITMLAIKVG